MSIRDIDEADFDNAVLERSKSVPVVVDFWATWCGPCQTLGPILESEVLAREGDIELVKVDVDRNPNLAARFQVKGIPAVMAFRDGRLVDQMTGALPAPGVRAFLDRLTPTEADRLSEAGRESLAKGDTASALESFRAALESDPRHGDAMLGHARCLRGEDPEQAAEWVAKIPLGSPAYDEAQLLAAELRLAKSGGADREALERAVETDARDLASRLALARALAAVGDYEAALPHYLEVVRQDRSFEDDAARKAMLDVFEILGPDDPATLEFRERLARLLFA